VVEDQGSRLTKAGGQWAATLVPSGGINHEEDSEENLLGASGKGGKNCGGDKVGNRYREQAA